MTWFDRPMRWSQLTLVENDPATFDLAFWLDYFKRTHSDGACLSAGGYIAYYPTKIPLHYRSAWLGEGDPFGDLVEGCRKLNMVVLARTDPHAVHEDVYRAHPDWIAVDAEGRKRRHWSMPEAWVTCALGPYNFEFMTEVHREIMSLYGVEGIFSNRWAGSGMCYCEHCRRNFKAASGMELPRSNDPQDPARRAHVLWRQERLFELARLWDSEIRKINREARYIPNSGGGALSGLDMDVLGDMVDTLFADRQGRSGPTPPWTSGKSAKEYRAAMGSKPVGGIFSVGSTDRYRWKDSVQSGAEIRLWVADAVANGLRPWYTKFAATIDDRRWLGVVEEIYRRHHADEPYLRNTASLARVGVVYSQQTARWYGGSESRRKVEDPTLGFYQALIEARIPFEMVHDRLLDAERLKHFKTLVLPNIAALSYEQCRQLREFVAGGGSLVATYETSLYNEWGARRTDFGLADLFGVSFLGSAEGPMQNAYLALEADPATGARHPLLDGLEGADRIIHGVHRLNVAPRIAFDHTPITLIPPYPDLPMEEVYARTPRSRVPEAYLRDLGKGRVVYFPWDIGRTFHEVLCPDHGRLLANAVEWATGEPRPVTVEGKGVLDVTVWRQERSMTVHLVNLTNPMMMRGPVREIYPVHDLDVEVRVPEGETVRCVRLLHGGASPEVHAEDGVIRLRVPKVEDHEIVAVDFERGRS